ncbi:MAG: preprotein translocase subunit SecG [Candidatus Bipolaricaulis sp.]|nr:preprotein translocase subunit SecG [Candidatus Bipolaricaulis sp.]
MAILKLIIEVVFFVDCFALMGIVLIQMSEHSGLGGAFGSGMSSTVFGRDEVKDPKRTLTIALSTVFLVLGALISFAPWPAA